MTCTKPGLRAATATPARRASILLGHRKSGAPIWWAGGAEGEVTAGEDDDDSDDDASAGGAESAADSWKPPTKEEWTNAEAARSKANKEAMQRRKWLQEHGIDPRTGKKVAADESDDVVPAADSAASGPSPADTKRALKEAADRAAAKTELKYRPALHKLAAKNALEEAGCDAGYRDLVLAGLDMSQVDVDDEGNVSGLDEQIADMKTRYPDVFKAKKTRAAAAPQAKTSGAEAVDGGNKITKPAKTSGDWRSKLMAQAGIDGD